MKEMSLRQLFGNSMLFVFAGLALVLLSGCASPTPARVTLDAGEGAISLKVLTDHADRNGTLWLMASHLELERVDSDTAVQTQAEAKTELKAEPEPSGADKSAGQGFYLRGQLRATRGTYVYSGMLKAGRYRIVSVKGWLGNRGWYVSLKDVLSTVEVREGEVLFLGTLLIKPRSGIVLGDRGEAGPALEVGYVPPNAELIESFERHAPALAAQVKGKPIQVLELTPELNEATQSALQFKRERSFAFNDLWQDEKGNFFAGSRLGKVLLKKAGQRSWLQFDVGSWDEVTTVRPYRGGLLAGGEDGLLRFSADDGKTWRSLVPPIWGHVQHLEVLPNGTLLTLMRIGSEWTAYVTDDALAGAWRKLGDLMTKEQAKSVQGFGYGLIYPGYPPTVVLHGDNLIFTQRGNSALVSMNIQTGRVELLAPLPIGTLHGMTTQPGGVVVLNGEVLKNATYASTDGARTWTEVKTRGLLAFRNDQVGYSLYGPDFAITRDGGKTWVYPRKSATWTVEQLRYFVIDRSDGALVAVLFNGAVLRSTDEGVTWVREY